MCCGLASSGRWCFNWLTWIVLQARLVSMATLAQNSGLWLRYLLNIFVEGCAYVGALQNNQTTSQLDCGWAGGLTSLETA